MTPTRRRYINAALYTATGVVTTFARLHFLSAHPVAQEIVGWVPALLALVGIGFHLATGDDAPIAVVVGDATGEWKDAAKIAGRVMPLIVLLLALPGCSREATGIAATTGAMLTACVAVGLLVWLAFAWARRRSWERYCDELPPARRAIERRDPRRYYRTVPADFSAVVEEAPAVRRNRAIGAALRGRIEETIRVIGPALFLLLVAFPARAQAPVLAGDVVRVEAVADPGVDAPKNTGGPVMRPPGTPVAVATSAPAAPGAFAENLRGEVPIVDDAARNVKPQSAVPPGAANLSTPVCPPATSKPVPLWAQVIGWAAAAIVEGTTLAVTIMQTRPQ